MELHLLSGNLAIDIIMKYLYSDDDLRLCGWGGLLLKAAGKLDHPCRSTWCWTMKMELNVKFKRKCSCTTMKHAQHRISTKCYDDLAEPVQKKEHHIPSSIESASKG